MRELEVLNWILFIWYVKNPGITQLKYVKNSVLIKGGARLVSNIETKGYLIRKPNPQDKRSQLLYASEKSESFKTQKHTSKPYFMNGYVKALVKKKTNSLHLYWILYISVAKKNPKNDFQTISKRIKE